MSEPTDDDVQAVLTANAAFYRAFEAADALRMDLLWAGLDADTCIHPGAEPIVGAMAVQRSWQRLFRAGERVDIELTDVHADVHGRMARVQLVENVSAHGDDALFARVACTNLFVRTDGGWRITLHHGSIIADDDHDGGLLLDPEPDTDEFH